MTYHDVVPFMNRSNVVLGIKVCDLNPEISVERILALDVDTDTPRKRTKLLDNPTSVKWQPLERNEITEQRLEALEARTKLLEEQLQQLLRPLEEEEEDLFQEDLSEGAWEYDTTRLTQVAR